MVYYLELSQSHDALVTTVGSLTFSSFQEEIPSGKRNIPIILLIRNTSFKGPLSIAMLVYQSVPHLKIIMFTFHLGGYKLDWWRVA